MQNSVLESSPSQNLEDYLERESAIELARRSQLGAPVYTAISLIMLAGTPMLRDYGWWAGAEAILLFLLGSVRVWFARDFENRYDAVGERAVVEFSVLTALQSLTLGVLSGMVIWQYWAAQEVMLTIVLSAGCVAAGTSALSVRRSAHLIFLLCVLAPFGFAVFLVGGMAKAALILGFLSLMAFLVQDGGQAKRVYIKGLKELYDEKIHRKRHAMESQAKRDFLMDIGHEIRTQVNSITGMTDLLLDEELGRRSREIAEIISESSGALLSLVGNMPGAIKSVQDLSDSELSSVDLASCISRVTGLYQPEAISKGLEFVMQIDDLPDTVMSCDENQLQQILANLLSNSLKFTDKGSITLSSRTTIRADGTLNIEFSVADTGIGIPSEHLEDVFDPFSPTLSDRSDTYDVGGLGLPLCKGLVELMGGKIWIENNPEGGTVVKFTIHAELNPSDSSWKPAEKTKGPKQTRDETELAKLHPHHILVVDDDDIHRQIVCALLQKLGYEADEAADGEEAITAVMRSQYDLIFMDLRMPHMSGTESSRWIRERFNGNREVRIIALTGDATHEARDRAMLAGMDNFVPKPVQIKDLEAVLRHSTGNMGVSVH